VLKKHSKIPGGNIGMFIAYKNRECGITSAENRTIYYSVRTKTADWGIVKARYVNGKYAEPELLSDGINSLYFDAHSCIAPDESFLIFDSKRPGAIGGEGDIDLYICFRNKKDKWGEVINMGDKINSPAQEHVTSLSYDGKYLFFARGEQDRWDIYWISAKIIEELKPNELE
jgi:Tol biopolymer transport system component